MRAVSVEIDPVRPESRQTVIDRPDDDLEVVEERPVPVPHDVHSPDPTGGRLR